MRANLYRRPTIEVHGRRWRDSHGNTYHTVHIRVDGRPMYTSPITYGYGDHYYHSTAMDWLTSNGYLTSEGYGQRLREARDVLGIQYEAEDVKRKRDLHERPTTPIIYLGAWDAHGRYRYHTVSGRYSDTGHEYYLRFADETEAKAAYMRLMVDNTQDTVDDIVDRLTWYDGRYHTR